MEDYDFTLQYHPGKANVVANALSWRSSGVLACLALRDWNRDPTMSSYNLQYCEGFGEPMVYNTNVVPELIQQVK